MLTLTLVVLALLLAGSVDAQPQSERKVVAPAHLLDDVPGARPWHHYGSYTLYALQPETLRNLPAGMVDQLRLADGMDRLEISAYPFDTQTDWLELPASLIAEESPDSTLWLVQFVGPIKAEWLAQVRAAGAEPIHYIANNGYLVWAGEAARAELDSLAAQRGFLQYSAPFHSFFKIGPALRRRLEDTAAGNVSVPVVIQMVRHDRSQETEAFVAQTALEIETAWSPILRYQNVYAIIDVSDIEALAHRPDINWIGERLPRQLHDEVQGQIIGGNFDAPKTGPLGPGFLAFLDGLGFSQTQADYPVLDITDDGIGNGTVSSGDPTLHEGGDLANPTRLAYVANCTTAASGEGPEGHGHINVSIAGGFDARSGFPFKDLDSFNRGLGINPYGRLAGTRVFGPNFNLSACGGTDSGLIQSIQDNGAGISSNSWGCSGCAGSYDDSSQSFDVGVRDADLSEAGNQELVIIFSSGNSGPGSTTVGTPGNGKNMITVGASESDRPSDEDGSWTDGCGVGPTGADNAMDVISFSSRGPAPGNRVKPEVIAPGTHIQGTASTSAAFNGNGVCDQYRPSGQVTFAASSGTSHSTPAVAGLASLVWWWIENGHGGEVLTSIGASPSPALIKAYLMAHPTYLTGVGANDTLPSNAQGYGMPNMNLLFDDTPKVLLDQGHLLDNSGESWDLVAAVADPSKAVRIAMAYTDEAGAIGTSPQVNDLNLSAEVEGTTYLGNVFSGQWSATGGLPDTANNYEAVFLPAGSSGAIAVTVTGFNIAGNGVPNTGDDTDQDFALVCYNCVQEPTFSLNVVPDEVAVCAPNSAVYTVNVGSILGFSDTVDLDLSGNPTGTTATFSVDPVSPPGSSTLSVDNTGSATPGSYYLDVSGTSTSGTWTRTVGLDIFDAVPAAPTLLSPANGATDQFVVPTFSWTEVAGTYSIQIATDAGFNNVADSATGLTVASYSPSTWLNMNATYYWRVWASGACGTGAVSQIWSFSTSDFKLFVGTGAFSGVAANPAHMVDVVSDNAVSVFSGFPVWGATADPSSQRVLLTSSTASSGDVDGSILYEWPLGETARAASARSLPRGRLCVSTASPWSAKVCTASTSMTTLLDPRDSTSSTCRPLRRASW